MAMDGIGNSGSKSLGREFQMDVNSDFQIKNRGSDNNKAMTGVDSFVDTLQAAIHKVDGLQKVADTKTEELITGKTDNIHDTMLAVEKADIALKLMVQVRNKVIDAYQEIMKMQV